jgi:acetylornithine deacetylase/succinyl-diaminopimelate desuccinylase family protein
MDVKPILDTESLFATVADLVSINSVNPAYPGGPGEGALADYVGEYCRHYSLPYELQPVFEGRPNVIARLEGEPGGPTLILEAHMDTASELGMNHKPFQPVRDGNRLYGRGSCDTKAGLAAMMHAMRILKQAGIRPHASVILVAAVDEEHSFRGVVKFVEKGIKAEGAIVAEPTDMETVVASKGCLRWRIRTRGRAAHSSKPQIGINAISKMMKIMAAMDETFPEPFAGRRHPLVGSPTVNVGIISGGRQVNQVPDWCTIDIDRRLIPGETKAAVWKEFESLIADLRARDPELEVEMEAPMLEDYPLETVASARIVQVIAKVSQELTGQHHAVGVPYGSDASKLAQAGTPSVILGPGNIDQAHAADEWVELDQVSLAAEVYARTILEF